VAKVDRESEGKEHQGQPHGKIPVHEGKAQGGEKVAHRHATHESTIGDHKRTKINDGAKGAASLQQKSGGDGVQGDDAGAWEDDSGRDSWDMHPGKHGR